MRCVDESRYSEFTRGQFLQQEVWDGPQILCVRRAGYGIQSQPTTPRRQRQPIIQRVSVPLPLQTPLIAFKLITRLWRLNRIFATDTRLAISDNRLTFAVSIRIVANHRPIVDPSTCRFRNPGHRKRSRSSYRENGSTAPRRHCRVADAQTRPRVSAVVKRDR